MNRAHRGAATLAVVSILVIGACGQGGQVASGNLEGATVTIRLFADFQSLNPYDVGPVQIGLATYSSLASVGPGAELIPYGAKSWSVTPTSVTFSIRNGFSCADGTPVTPSVVANSLQHLGTDQDFPNLAEAFGPGGFVSAIADDSAGTVKVTVGSPYGDLLYWIAPQPIVCPAGLADRTLLDTQTFGSGPYT